MNDEEAKRRQAREEEIRARRQVEDLRAQLSTSGGRRFLWQIIHEMSGAMDRTYTGEALSGAYREGKREVGLLLTERAQKADAPGYLLMVREAIEEEDQLRRVLDAEAEEAF